MIKRIVVIVLIASFFNFSISPAFAETQAEKDERIARSTTQMIRLGAFVGILFMLSKMGNSNLTELNYYSFKEGNPTDKSFKLSFDYYEPNYDYRAFKEKHEYMPMLKLSRSW